MNITPTIFLLAIASAGIASAEGLALQSASGLGHQSDVSTAPNNAATSSGANALATTTSQGGAAAGGAAQGVGSQGQSLSIDSHAVYEAQARNPVATAVAPALTSSNDTCMGSTSVGASAWTTSTVKHWKRPASTAQSAGVRRHPQIRMVPSQPNPPR